MKYQIKNKRSYIIIHVSVLLVALFSVALPANAFSTSETTKKAHEQEQFIDVKQVIPSVVYDIRYASKNNFVGDVINGYLAKKCYIHRAAISDLKAVTADLAKQGYRLKLFDCYRPEKAVTHFMRWAKNLTDTKTKAEYYPNIAKSTLVGPYIAEKSGHSKGYTLDLTLQKKLNNGEWQDLDMGTHFDLFDVLSNTDNKHVSLQQRNNRDRLRDIMQAHGFSNYPMEWWHFTHTKTPKSQRQSSYDFDVK